MRFFLLVLILVCGNTWSSNPEKPESRSGNQQAKTEQRGTEKAPVFIKGEVTTEKNKEEAKNDADERKVKAEIDAELVKYTGWLALFTFLLFCFTAALWWVTYRLSKDAKTTSDRQAREMEESLSLAKKQIALSTDEFLSTHRPRLILREAFAGISDKQPIVVCYSIVNIGGSRARIIQSKLAVETCFGPYIGLKQPPLALGKDDVGQGNETLEPGELKGFEYSSPHTWPQGASEITNSAIGELIFSGQILYEDERKIRRHMAFYRTFDPANCRFFARNTDEVKQLDYSD